MPLDLQPAKPRSFLYAGGLVVAVSAFAAFGYFATAAVRPYLLPAVGPADDRIEPEPRVVENLPLYAVADDLAFVIALAKPDLFGDEPAVAYDPLLRAPPGTAADKPTSKPVWNPSRRHSMNCRPPAGRRLWRSTRNCIRNRRSNRTG